jgi:hypothetical protein
MDPDPGGPKTYESDGSGFATLLGRVGYFTESRILNLSRYLINFFCLLIYVN